MLLEVPLLVEMDALHGTMSIVHEPNTSLALHICLCL